MDTDDSGASLNDEATFAGVTRRRAADASLGDERTLGGGDAASIDTVFDDIEVVDLAARYKTEGTLGRGAMGEVFLALDIRLGRKVAIKRILGEAARSRTAVSRFLTEAKAIAALNHPNVVQIYDYGRAADGPFLIMEYVDGGSLLDLCKAGPVPLDRAVDLVSQVCDGLAKAHDLGIVHRDIKPANVLLTKDGLPKLTDFGLAKAEATDHQMTMTGAVLGTPDFMPPEQRRDAALVDARSDLWSLAATLYQMVTGRSPKIIHLKYVPESLRELLDRALDDEREQRQRSVRHFRDELRAAVGSVRLEAEGRKAALGHPSSDGPPGEASDLASRFLPTESSYAIGLHLGGSALKIAAVPTDRDEPITYGHHFRRVAACGTFSSDGQLLLGDDATREVDANDVATIVSGFTTILGAPNGKRGSWAVHRDALLVDGRDGSRELSVGEQRFSPELLTRRLLQGCVSIFGEDRFADGRALVAALPATLGTLGLAAFKRAAATAGMPVTHVMAVTQAEALACTWDDRCRGIPAEAGPRMVVHWGGGNFETTVFDSSGDCVQVLATKGDASLGADHCTAGLVDHLLTGGLGVDARARSQLWNQAEAAKVRLSDTLDASIQVPGHDPFSLSRSSYESVCYGVMNGIREVLRAVLSDSGVPGDAISRIYLTGGASRTPLLRSILAAETPSALVCTPVEPERMAALGAGLRSATLRGQLEGELLLLAAWPHSIGVAVEGHGREGLVSRNLNLPLSRRLVLETASDRTGVLLYEGEGMRVDDDELVGSIEVATPSRHVTISVDVGVDGDVEVGVAGGVDTGTTVCRLPHFDMQALNAAKPLPPGPDDTF